MYINNLKLNNFKNNVIFLAKSKILNTFLMNIDLKSLPEVVTVK